LAAVPAMRATLDLLLLDHLKMDNEYSFVESRKEAINKIMMDDKFSFFDSLTSMSGTEEYQSCQVSPIPTK
jgi:hypothetical protein